MENWDTLYKKGLEGYYYKSIGEIEKCKIIFEYCIENGSDNLSHFEPLWIIYKREKRYKDCDRIIRKSLEIYKKWFDNNNFHYTWKIENEKDYMKLKKRYDSIQKHL